MKPGPSAGQWVTFRKTRVTNTTNSTCTGLPPGTCAPRRAPSHPPVPPEQPQRLRSVLVLRPLALARDHDARRHVRHAHGAVGRVDVLPARAARAEGVDPQVRLLDGHVRLEGWRGSVGVSRMSDWGAGGCVLACEGVSRVRLGGGGHVRGSWDRMPSCKKGRACMWGVRSCWNRQAVGLVPHNSQGAARRTSVASASTATVAVPVCVLPAFSVKGTACRAGVGRNIVCRKRQVKWGEQAGRRPTAPCGRAPLTPGARQGKVGMGARRRTCARCTPLSQRSRPNAPVPVTTASAARMPPWSL